MQNLNVSLSGALDNPASPAPIPTICAFPLTPTSHHSDFCVYAKTQTYARRLK